MKAIRSILELSDIGWQDSLSRDYLAGRECAALSVGFPPHENSFEFAQEQTSDPLSDHPQIEAYHQRKFAIEKAIQARQIPDLQPAELNDANPVRWIDTPEHVALVPFVSWAIYQKWWIPLELAAIRSVCQQSQLINKYVGVVPNIHSRFSNQARSEKRPGSCHISLKEAAHYESVSVRGAWDEYALLIWLKDKGAL